MKKYKCLWISLLAIIILLSSCGIIESKFANREGIKASKNISKIAGVKSAVQKVSNIDGYVRLSLLIDLEKNAKFYDTYRDIKTITDNMKTDIISVVLNQNEIKLIWNNSSHSKETDEIDGELLKNLLDACKISQRAIRGQYNIFIAKQKISQLESHPESSDTSKMVEQQIFKSPILENVKTYSIKNQSLAIKFEESKNEIIEILNSINMEKLSENGVNAFSINYIKGSLPHIAFSFLSEEQITNHEAIVKYIEPMIESFDSFYIKFHKGLYNRIDFYWNSEKKAFELYNNSKNSKDQTEDIKAFKDYL
ncbi:MAG: hypothetical protein Q4P29_02790 [Tissierellia bacterium]|nr:hypothetical protein [Tissierellia bacterium]